WQPDLASMRRLATRLLGYAGLDRLRVRIEPFESDDPTPSAITGAVAGASAHHVGAAAFFAGIDGDTCLFGADTRLFDDPDRLVAALAHETAHAFRTFHGLCVKDRDEEERLTDLTTIYLGFGVLTTNASYRYRASGRMMGSMTVTEWSHEALGYLSPQ